MIPTTLVTRITLSRIKTMLCGTDSILWNIRHIQPIWWSILHNVVSHLNNVMHLPDEKLRDIIPTSPYHTILLSLEDTQISTHPISIFTDDLSSS